MTVLSSVQRISCFLYHDKTYLFDKIDLLEKAHREICVPAPITRLGKLKKTLCISLIRFKLFGNLSKRSLVKCIWTDQVAGEITRLVNGYIYEFNRSSFK